MWINRFSLKEQPFCHRRLWRLGLLKEHGKSISIPDFLLEINEFEKPYVDKMWTIFGSCIAGFVVLVVILFAIYRKYKYTIQYWYLMLYKQIRKDGASNEMIPSLYGAFISYCHADWEDIYPIIKLLESKDFNISFDDKTFVSGKSIASNIVDTIDNSNKVIFSLIYHIFITLMFYFTVLLRSIGLIFPVKMSFRYILKLH